jgi:hypothetical protein
MATPVNGGTGRTVYSKRAAAGAVSVPDACPKRVQRPRIKRPLRTFAAQPPNPAARQGRDNRAEWLHRSGARKMHLATQ